jgi:hypothetical protein
MQEVMRRCQGGKQVRLRASRKSRESFESKFNFSRTIAYLRTPAPPQWHDGACAPHAMMSLPQCYRRSRWHERRAAVAARLCPAVLPV